MNSYPGALSSWISKQAWRLPAFRLAASLWLPQALSDSVTFATDSRSTSSFELSLGYSCITITRATHNLTKCDSLV